MYKSSSTLTTNQVQSFVRLIAFLVSLGILSIIFLLPISAISVSMFGNGGLLTWPALVVLALISRTISQMFYILPEWQSIVILRLGKFSGVRGAGFFVIPPFIYSVASIIDMRIVTQQVEATATLTKDNVPIKVTAAVEYKVEDPQRATIDVLDYRSSVVWLSTEALKNTIGSLDLKELLSERDEIASNLKNQIDAGAAVYGVDVRAVRLTDIDTPSTLVEELAVIARARRSAEAKTIEAEAEILVAEKIKEAGEILRDSEHGIKLRELQIISEMSKEESSTIIVYPYGERNGAEIAHSSAGNLAK